MRGQQLLKHYRSAPKALLLRCRVLRLCSFLKRRGIRCQINVHTRYPALAHRWSVAHHLLNGTLTIGDLRALPAGRDQDGHLWLAPQWDDLDLPPDAPARNLPKVSAQATRLAAPDGVYAEEGYPPGHSARRPNPDEVPVSLHVQGLAIDLGIDWTSVDDEDPWGATVNAWVARFKLARPIPDEPWHFTLP
jgi:hypothetical protein